MKTTRILSIAMTLAMGMIAGLHASVTEHQPPAPLPEFKTPEQLAKWRAETTARTAIQELTSSRLSTQDSSTPFYTGKPYLAESGSYAFKYREYNPEMGRWSTVDPSGFPDGANNRVYAAIPTSEFDLNGLVSFSISAKNINYNKNPIYQNGYTHNVILNKITSVDPSQSVIKQLTQSYGNTYNFSIGKSLQGNIDINTYQASYRNKSPSIKIIFIYNGTTGPAFGWIQIFTKTTSFTPPFGPYIDTNDNKPFYPNAILSFQDDIPFQHIKDDPFNYPTVSCSTYPAVISGNNVTLYGGIQWGGLMNE